MRHVANTTPKANPNRDSHTRCFYLVSNQTLARSSRRRVMTAAGWVLSYCITLLHSLVCRSSRIGPSGASGAGRCPRDLLLLLHNFRLRIIRTLLRVILSYARTYLLHPQAFDTHRASLPLLCQLQKHRPCQCQRTRSSFSLLVSSYHSLPSTSQAGGVSWS